MTSTDLQILTGWSRATLYRRMRAADFPQTAKMRRGRPVWNAVEILEWISKHNLRAVLGVEDALEFERRLAGNVLADPSLNSPIVRAIERDVARQKRPRDKL